MNFMEILNLGKNIKISENGEKKEYFLNGVKKKNAATFAGNFAAVVFSPDHLPLVKNGPGERRRFMNTAISQLWPQYMAALYAYSRALLQRNAVLRDARFHTDLLDLLDSYEREMAKKGMQITTYRNRYCAMLKEKAVAIYDGIAGGKERFPWNMRRVPKAKKNCSTS